MTDLLTRLTAFGPHNGPHRVAGRATITIVVPLLVLEATDHLSWSIYATFGAFTSLYGRERVDLPRVRLQSLLADVHPVRGRTSRALSYAMLSGLGVLLVGLGVALVARAAGRRLIPGLSRPDGPA